jgi:dihydrofolate synthase/folylpolyglutamate synthase
MPIESSDYLAALQLIHVRSNYDRGYISNPRSGPDDLVRGLQRVRAVLEAMGQPDRTYPIVHVAGSKGKGSTSAFIAGIGRAAGYRCGLFTSPHLHSFRERIAIDGNPIDETTFAASAFAVDDAIQQL